MGLAEAALRCECGHGIFCKVGSEGEHIGFLAFFDNESSSETYGHQVERCPNCGEQLGLPMFFGQNRAR